MEDITDPLGDRVVKSVPPLARLPLTKDELWHNSGKYINIYSIIIDLFLKPNPETEKYQTWTCCEAIYLEKVISKKKSYLRSYSEQQTS